MLGNPTLYRDKVLTWTHARVLESYDSGRVKFEYDQNNLRTSKGTSRQTTDYFYAGGQLLAEKRSAEFADLYVGDELGSESGYTAQQRSFITYLYGVDGITGFTLKQGDETKVYHYRKNMQGDVTQIYTLNEEGKLDIVASYTYDAWGNHLVSNHTFDNIGDLNPIRYRGYYFDIETGLYYLKTRYYDPQTGRFINMDKIEILDESITLVNGLNLYAYAGNNPVMNVDEDGMFLRRLFRGLWRGFRNTVVGMWNTVVGIVTNPLGFFESIGRFTVGLFTGESWVAMGNALWGMVQNTWNFINPVNMIRNPESWGEQAGQGLAIALTMGVGKVVKGVAKFGRARLGTATATRAGGASGTRAGVSSTRSATSSTSSRTGTTRSSANPNARPSTGGSAGQVSSRLNDQARIIREINLDQSSLLRARQGSQNWNAMRQRIWRNEARVNPNFYGPNVERMRRGAAPIGLDGRSMQLHHVRGIGQDIHNVVRLTRTQHRNFHRMFGGRPNPNWNMENLLRSLERR